MKINAIIPLALMLSHILIQMNLTFGNWFWSDHISTFHFSYPPPFTSLLSLTFTLSHLPVQPLQQLGIPEIRKGTITITITVGSNFSVVIPLICNFVLFVLFIQITNRVHCTVGEFQIFVEFVFPMEMKLEKSMQAWLLLNFDFDYEG